MGEIGQRGLTNSWRAVRRRSYVEWNLSSLETNTCCKLLH